MLSVISDKTQHEEASVETRTFDLIMWVRARRLQWLGHILRMGTERKLKQAVFELFKAPSPGDLLMDAPTRQSWYELQAYAADKEYWKARVRKMRQPRVSVKVRLGEHFEEGKVLAFTIS